MLLEVRGLSVKIGRKKIVDDVSFGVDAGENVAVIGANGAGKTTMLRAIAGLNDYSGSIFVDGAEMRSMTSLLRAKRISYVPQGGAVDGDFTVLQFVELSRFPYRKPWEPLTPEDRTAVEQGLALTETLEFAGRRLSTLSGGERQRVVLAGAIAQNTPILLLDEPLTFLDPRQRRTVSEITRRIVESGRTVIMVTHEIKESLLYSTRILALAGGKLVFDGNSKELEGSLILNRLFGLGSAEF
ncbi:ABC transporter ATP-binding protein [bacterium]|nr:ABC transporter ATP-binding protein [bacterium]